MPITALEIANCPVARRGNWLYKAFYLTEGAFGAVLFPYLVSDYKAASTKTKALYIYDNCVFQSAVVHMDKPTTLDLHGVVDTARMSPASLSAIDSARAQRVSAQSMNWFKRVATSGDRKASAVTGPGVFDELLAQHLAPPKGDNPWNDILPVIETAASPKSVSLYSSMKARFPRTAEELNSAGFDLDKIGINYIKMIFKG